MMKKNKLLLLCVLLLTGSICLTACGGNRNNGTEAPYEDETDNKVNDSQNGANNRGGMDNDLKDAGRNLMDSIRDTGDALREGVNKLGNGNRNNNNETNP
jgi:predicted small secreted protein